MRVALVGEKGLRADLEPIGGKAVHAHHRIGPLRAGANVVADAGLQVEPGIDRPAVKRLHFRPFPRAAEIALPLRLAGDAVEVAADPAFPFPMLGAGAPAPALFRSESRPVGKSGLSTCS